MDSIAQARTGTGKTLGFLIPVIQRIINNNPELGKSAGRFDRARASDIRAIVISPTRELAEQIAVEALKITRSTGIRVQVAVGGARKSDMLRKMQREGCHLLVATPGRLKDILTDEYSRVAAPDLSALVLDEADRLLDDGFSADIEEIISFLPDRSMVDRQTLLFSATVPKEVMHLVQRTLKPDFEFIQTVRDGELATHERIPQQLVEANGFENIMPALLELCKREINNRSSNNVADAKPFKAIVYFTSTANVELAYQIFDLLQPTSGSRSSFGKGALWPCEVSCMHGKLTQAQRTRVTDRFRRARSAVMFSSDVTARGMDFPNVTHVIQIGLPPNSDQYVHRVGRTGRGDNSGEGWLFITPVELRDARRMLRSIPISRDVTLESAKVDMTQDAQLPADIAAILQQVSEATQRVDKDYKVAAYMAQIGVMKNSDKQDMIDTLNQWTRYGWGWEKPPGVSRALAQKLGLARLRGIELGGNRARTTSVFGDDDTRDRNSDYGGLFGSGRSNRGVEGFGRRSFEDTGRGRDFYGGDRRQGSGGSDRGRGFSGSDRGRGFGGNDRRRAGNGGAQRASF